MVRRRMLAVLLVAGCFSDSVGGSGSASDAGSTGTTGVTSSATAADVTSAGATEPPGPVSCDNGILDGTETDRDCGGNCPACPIGSQCDRGLDCETLVCAGDTCEIPRNCLDIASSDGVNALDGVYEIDPDGMGPVMVYCDLQGDDPGWTLVLAYDHAANDTRPLEIGTFPTSVNNDYSHASDAQLQRLTFTQLRFECSSEATTRRIHFSTDDVGAVEYIRGDALNPMNATAWNMGFTPLEGHSGMLPAAAADGFGAMMFFADRGLTEFPFFLEDMAHWGLDAGPTGRWECDDFRGGGPGNNVATRHRVWVR